MEVHRCLDAVKFLSHLSWCFSFCGLLLVHFYMIVKRPIWIDIWWCFIIALQSSRADGMFWFCVGVSQLAQTLAPKCLVHVCCSYGSSRNIHNTLQGCFFLISSKRQQQQQQPSDCLYLPPTILIYPAGSWHASFGPSIGVWSGGHALVSTPWGSDASITKSQGCCPFAQCLGVGIVSRWWD